MTSIITPSSTILFKGLQSNRSIGSASIGSLSLDDTSLLGESDEIWDLVQESLGVDDNNGILAGLEDLPPIPAHILASGALIEADGYHEEDFEPIPVHSTPRCLALSTKKRSLQSRGYEASKKKEFYEWMGDRKLVHVSDSSTVTGNVHVGPNSVQMKVVKRMIVFLQEQVKQSDNPHFRIWLEAICQVTSDCEMRHLRGENKYRHLPGSIFEKLVDHIGGESFGHIYHGARSFEHNRLKELNLLDEDPIEPEDTTVPSVLEIAVGYGLHLATTHVEPRGQEVNGDTPSQQKDLHAMVRHGAKIVTNMNEEERGMFWQYMTQN